MWVQGWFINVTYYHRTLGWRNVWAMAIHSDGIVYGNDWIRVDFLDDWHTSYHDEDPRDMGSLIYGAAPYSATPAYNGGRKTNGTAVTDPITVLYDGPREFIAICRTTIYDHPVYQSNSTLSDIPLVQVAITIRFDKVKKDVVLLKDVKSLLAWKEGEKMKIQLSNRGEVDLGTDATAYGSYAHFWTEGTSPYDQNDTLVEGQPTVYDSSWTLVPTEDPEDPEYPNYSAAGPYPQDADATYDVAQALNPLAGYVWSAAFWPSLSDWTIDGWEQWWHSLTANDPHYIDYRDPNNEPFIPFYIGEWDFVLWHTGDNDNRTQFRGVTQYAVTEWHDADDEAYGVANVIDTEMRYYLNETFNPWDLEDAVHKDTRRWLQWKDAGDGTSLTTKWKPVVVVSSSEWDDYCNFADRVIDYNTGELLNRAQGEYTLSLNEDGTATFSGLLNLHKYKILYSTDAYYEKLDIDPLLFTWNTTAIKADPSDDYYDYDDQSWTDPLGMDWTVEVNDISFTATVLNTTNSFNATLSRELNGWETYFEVFKGDAYTGSWDFQDLELLTDVANVSIDVSLVDIHWSVYNPTLQDLYVWELGFTATLRFDMFYNATGDYMELNATVDLDPADPYVGMTVMYSEGQRGRYEWAIVGRDAKTVDSAGAALITESFDSFKEIQIGIAGADMNSTLVYDQMPYVMAKFGAGTAKNDYKDGILRAALKDDWCTYWPVASSNMIGTGGPLANVFAYYANDFTDAFYGLPTFSGTAYSEMITGIPCWNRGWDGSWNVYGSSATTGYAVITTYKDINGTVIFDVWGHWGRDTYYASMWLHGDEARGMSPGIIELQSAPKGATSIILEIDYTDPAHPTYSIPEVLGTISETLWYHEGTDVTDPEKGGIHDP
jgi:hypothetical protein